MHLQAQSFQESRAADRACSRRSTHFAFAVRDIVYRKLSFNRDFYGVPNDLAGTLKLLAAYRHDLTGVVVESTYNWYWLVDGLLDAGYEVKLANPSAIKKYEGLKHSGDDAGARYLAHLLRLGILPTGSILPPELRATRNLARKCMPLVRSPTLHILAAENITPREYGRRISSNEVMQRSAEDVDAMPLPDDVKYALEANVAVVEAIGEQIKML